MAAPIQLPRAVAALLVAAALAACSAPPLPPVTESPTGEQHLGKFVWYDLLTENEAAARTFYGDVFGWTFEQVAGSDGYVLIRSGGTAIAGLAEIEERDAEAVESLWLSSLSVADVDTAAALVKDQGGSVELGPETVEGRGRLVAVRDPSGAALVLLRSASGDPVDAEPRIGAFLWTDLWTDDAAAAKDFYGALVGYQTRAVRTGPGVRYQILGRDGRPRAGLVEVDMEGIEPSWLPYVRVASVAGVVQRARAGGGSVLLERKDLAVLIDPTGAAIGVQRWSGRSGS